MGFNLVDLTQGNINDEVINLVSRAIRGSNEHTQLALDAIIPRLLSKLSKITSSKLATEALYQAINNQDETILDNLTEQLIDDNHLSLASSGAFSVNSLLGIRGIQSLVDGVVDSSGLSRESSSSLLGITMPIVLSVIKSRLIEDDKLNSPGVVEVLGEQKELMEDALPSRVEDRVVENTSVGKTMTEKKAEPRARKPVIQGNEAAPSLTAALLPLFVLPIILFFAYHFFYPTVETPMTLPEMQKASKSKQSDPLLKDEAKSLAELNHILESVESLLNGIVDTHTAKAKQTGLEKNVESLNILGQKMQAMSKATKKEAASLVKSRIPQMQTTVDRINEIPGGASVIEPIFDELIRISVDTFI